MIKIKSSYDLTRYDLVVLIDQSLNEWSGKKCGVPVWVQSFVAVLTGDINYKPFLLFIHSSLRWFEQMS